MFNYKLHHTWLHLLLAQFTSLLNQSHNNVVELPLQQ